MRKFGDNGMSIVHDSFNYVAHSRHHAFLLTTQVDSRRAQTAEANPLPRAFLADALGLDADRMVKQENRGGSYGFGGPFVGGNECEFAADNGQAGWAFNNQEGDIYEENGFGGVVGGERTAAGDIEQHVTNRIGAGIDCVMEGGGEGYGDCRGLDEEAALNAPDESAGKKKKEGKPVTVDKDDEL